MKKCPVCQANFGDEKRFCQVDGTPLLEVVEKITPPEDPFKTVIGVPPPTTSPNISDDAMKTFVVSSDKKEEDLLQIPEVFDPMKTMVVSEPIKFDRPTTPPPPKVTNEPVVPAPEPPKFTEPSLSPPNFRDFSSNEPPKIDPPTPFSPPTNEPPKIVESPIPNPFSPPPTMVETPKFEATPPPIQSTPTVGSPFDQPFSPSIPSPFDQPVAAPPPFEEPQPMPMQAPQTFGNSPFDQPAQSFGQPNNDPFNQPVQNDAGWNPLAPAAPNWGNQPVAQGMGGIPSTPVGASAGQDKTLAIISLVVGIIALLSVLPSILIWICSIVPFGLGIAAAITGFLARSRANANPSQYSGGGLGMFGLILGVLSVIGSVLAVVLTFVLIGYMGTR